MKFKSVSHGQIHLYCKLRVNIFNRFEMAPFCFWRTFVFASKDGAADAAPTYMMRQTNIFRLVAVNFCLLQPETHNDKRKRPDSAVIDMGDTIIKNVPFMFYDEYC